MLSVDKPSKRPLNSNFSSGPCAKRPGWTPNVLSNALVGRSHRSAPGKKRIQEVIDKTRLILGIPENYRIGIVAGSDTGAVEMALWSMLGARGVDMLQWESFGKGWVGDVINQLKLDNVRELKSDYGKLPNLNEVDFTHDVVFTWNGTTSGVRVPNADWIPVDREGLTFCDATSAVFAMNLEWNKLDVTTYSWQKVMGGEAQHGMLVLSPRAVERLESYTPSWPLPKIFRLTSGGKLIESVFKAATINTPSMLCVEDALDGLNWAISIGGLKSLIKRSEANLTEMAKWVWNSNNVDFLAEDFKTQSCTSVCLNITCDWFVNLSKEKKEDAAKKVVVLLDLENIAYDIGSYRDAPPGLRIWCGGTIEVDDIKALTSWIEWALSVISIEYSA
jgi:phosphoserine aminotransferase